MVRMDKPKHAFNPHDKALLFYLIHCKANIPSTMIGTASDITTWQLEHSPEQHENNDIVATQCGVVDAASATSDDNIMAGCWWQQQQQQQQQQQ